jgi:hypothetical protein
MPMTSEKLRRSKKVSKANRGQLSVLTEAPNAGVEVTLARSSRIDNQQNRTTPSRGGLAASLRGYSPKWPIAIGYGGDLTP